MDRAGTQRDREREQTDTERDRETDNFNGQLKRLRMVKLLSVKKFDKIKF
jgi:hypothetical protein